MRKASCNFKNRGRESKTACFQEEGRGGAPADTHSAVAHLPEAGKAGKLLQLVSCASVTPSLRTERVCGGVHGCVLPTSSSSSSCVCNGKN